MRRHITVGLAAALLLVVGCQKLPPGVLAGSRSVGDTKVPSMAGDESQRADVTVAAAGSIGEFEALRQELEATRAEQARLRELLARSVEQTMTAQAELVDLYRERALAAESRIASMEREMEATRVAVGETESVTR